MPEHRQASVCVSGLQTAACCFHSTTQGCARQSLQRPAEQPTGLQGQGASGLAPASCTGWGRSPVSILTFLLPDVTVLAEGKQAILLQCVLLRAVSS